MADKLLNSFYGIFVGVFFCSKVCESGNDIFISSNEDFPACQFSFSWKAASVISSTQGIKSRKGSCFSRTKRLENWHLAYPSTSLACTNYEVGVLAELWSASSWLLWRCSVLWWVASHSHAHDTTKRVPFFTAFYIDFAPGIYTVSSIFVFEWDRSHYMLTLAIYYNLLL